MSDVPATGDADTASPRGRRLRRSVVMVVLGLVAAGTALFVMDRRSTPPLPGEAAGPGGEPDFFMEGATVDQYRPDGTLEYRLTSDDIRHFSEQALTRLQRPALTLYRPGGRPWNARALEGDLRRPPRGAPEEELELRDDVVLEQNRGDGAFLRLTTSRLKIYPGRQYAESDRDVMIDSHVGRTTATGLEGDLQLGLLTFLSSGSEPVHTVLQPQQFK